MLTVCVDFYCFARVMIKIVEFCLGVVVCVCGGGGGGEFGARLMIHVYKVG